ncbi:MAG: nucleotidyltransferase family protein [Methanosarcinales archaeon]
MNEEILRRVKDLACCLAKTFSVESIVLFGSFVEGKPEPNDIDLFLVGDLNKSEIIAWIVEYCISNKWYADGLPHVQILCEGEANSEIIREINQKGITLYGNYPTKGNPYSKVENAKIYIKKLEEVKESLDDNFSKKRWTSVISASVEVCDLGILAILTFYEERISGRHATNFSHFAGRFYLEHPYLFNRRVYAIPSAILERYSLPTLRYTPVVVRYEDAKDVYEKVCYFYDEVMGWAKKKKLSQE